MSRVPDIRIRALNDAAVCPKREYVLYWMVATRRLTWNFALDRAVDYAEQLNKPLVILEALDVDYRWASDRHHRAVLDGMFEHRESLRGGPVYYFAYVEPTRRAGRGLLRSLAAAACVVVSDDSPTFFTPSLLEAAARSVPCLAEAVDSCGLLPLRAADKAFGAAYHFRRFLHKELPAHLGDRPTPDRLRTARIPPIHALPEGVASRWSDASDDLLSGRAGTSALPIDHSVTPTGWVGGNSAAREALDQFLEDGFRRYEGERNHPDAEATSGLSPWLHYGHISVHEIFASVAQLEGWTPLRLAAKADGRRSGWWGMSPSAESFLDELVTWRELGFGFCTHAGGYERYETLPAWAIETLEAHAGDAREHVYTLDEFDLAATHDELWNAAQRQLSTQGTIHNYLRMLWGKKILEWSPHPRDALEIMIELNNRYALDGRDPNSYTGITWILGRFDRGWPERPIFGKVRSMTSASTRKKVRLSRYLETWGDPLGARPVAPLSG